MPLKSVPLTPVPLRVKGIDVSALDGADRLTVALKVPAFSLSHWLALARGKPSKAASVS